MTIRTTFCHFAIFLVILVSLAAITFCFAARSVFMVCVFKHARRFSDEHRILVKFRIKLGSSASEKHETVKTDFV